MTIASPHFRWRRVLVLCAATVLLHFLAIGWVGARLAAPGDAGAPADSTPIVAELRAPPPPVAQPPVETPPARPKRAPRPAPKRAIAPPAPLADAGPLPLPPESASAAVSEAGAPLPEVPVQSAEPEAAQAAAADAAPAEPVPAPGYKTSLPPSAELTMDVARTDAKGAEWSGQAVLGWRHGGGSYRMSMVASITILVTINLAELVSEGSTGEAGIMPQTMTEKRRNRAQTATHFDAQQGRITFSAATGSVPLKPGTQDKASFPMQLAAIGRADPAQLEAGIEMLVGEDRSAKVYRFTLVGQEELDTRMGKMMTWRLTRAPLIGSYNSRLDVWLAPEHNWYPVQMRSTESNGAVTTQTIRRIAIKE